MEGARAGRGGHRRRARSGARGMPQHAWYYFAIFVGVIVGLMFEPLPGGAIGLIGVALVALLSQYVFFSPDQLAKAGFNAPRAA